MGLVYDDPSCVFLFRCAAMFAHVGRLGSGVFSQVRRASISYFNASFGCYSASFYLLIFSDSRRFLSFLAFV